MFNKETGKGRDMHRITKGYNMRWYNRRSIRLWGYDYSLNGIYFVTICTKDKENYFGQIVCRDAIYGVLLNQMKYTKITMSFLGKDDFMITLYVRNNH